MPDEERGAPDRDYGESAGAVDPASDGVVDPATLDDLVSALAADDSEARASAAWRLAELAADHPDRSWRLPVESKLVPLLDDDDRWVRRGASWAVASVAADHPERVRSALDALAAALADEDPLVRENAVLALSDVADEYPLAVEPALSRLATVVRDGDGLARQYAADTLRRLVRKLDEDGFPRTIAATPALADHLPTDADVVETTDEPSDDGAVEVRGTGGRSVEREDDDRDEAETSESDDGTEESLGPPADVPDPPAVAGDRRDFEHLADLGGDPLTAAAKARAPAGPEDGQGVVVTVRTLRTDASVDSGAVEAAFRAWAGVDDHDHVLPVLARGTTPRPWVATEFADGGTLRDHVGGVGFDRGLWYAHCVTTAVCHAHGRGVVHGALRPGAVGLSRALGAWPVPKVGDWGLSDAVRAVRNPPVPAGFAAPEHVAPEEFGGPDPATDVYGLGALCYAIFAGRPPFVGDASAVARKVRSEDPAPPSAFASDLARTPDDGLPRAVDDLVERALATEKRARFETAEDFRRELEVVVEEFGPADGWP